MLPRRRCFCSQKGNFFPLKTRGGLDGSRCCFRSSFPGFDDQHTSQCQQHSETSAGLQCWYSTCPLSQCPPSPAFCRGAAGPSLPISPQLHCWQRRCCEVSAEPQSSSLHCFTLLNCAGESLESVGISLCLGRSAGQQLPCVTVPRNGQVSPGTSTELRTAQTQAGGPQLTRTLFFSSLHGYGVL